MDATGAEHSPPRQVRERIEFLPLDGLPKLLRAPLVLLKFSRPHTVLGSAVSIVSLTLMGALSVASGPVCATTAFWMRYLSVLMVALVPSMLMNVYIVGLNQVFDVSIDRVNKPYLPLASGELSVRAGASLTVTSLVAALVLGFALPLTTTALRLALILSALIGTAYSLPPVRLKRFALLASVCVLCVRGAVINIGFFAHALLAMSASPSLTAHTFTPVIRFATAFFVLFGVVIALMKDIPDVRGDRAHQLRSFSVRFGERRVFWFCVSTLVGMYAAAAMACLTPWLATRSLLRSAAGSLAHLGMGAWLLRRSVRVREEEGNPPAVYDFYMDVWTCFYLEYLVLPLLC